MASEEKAQLLQQLAAKDEMLNTMKIKTKEFVQKLKEDHAAAISAAETNAQQALLTATQV